MYISFFFSDIQRTKKYLCINPYHYGYETPQIAAQNSTEDHLCRNYARIQATGSTLKIICKICRHVLTDEDLADDYFEFQAPVISNPSKCLSLIFPMFCTL